MSNIIFTQYLSASFPNSDGTSNHTISLNNGSPSIALEILTHDGYEGITSFTIFLYADPSIIKLTGASWHIPYLLQPDSTEFIFNNFDANLHNDTLKIAGYAINDDEIYYGDGGKMLDISFDIEGDAGETTELKFIRFEDDY